jgi:hypothetical protein
MPFALSLQCLRPVVLLLVLLLGGMLGWDGGGCRGEGGGCNYIDVHPKWHPRGRWLNFESAAAACDPWPGRPTSRHPWQVKLVRFEAPKSHPLHGKPPWGITGM